MMMEMAEVTWVGSVRAGGVLGILPEGIEQRGRVFPKEGCAKAGG